ncbi:MAG: lactonase family protein [Lachnospiraceae bacterium]|nr:lactonase family protein [Lachnospiraceae bacterium]
MAVRSRKTQGKSDSKGKYVCYCAGYTRSHDQGITIFDFDPDTGRMKERSKIKITNASYIAISHNGKFLYSITDDGVAAFVIEKNGDLTFLNMTDINGMRGCYLSTDYEDKYVFVAGYHDGKVTVLSINPDGSVNRICDEIYQKGIGTIAERNFRPHVDCAKMTRDNKYLCATDVGMDQTKIYRLDHKTGKLTMVDVLRSDIESAPHHIKFSLDGKFAYIIHELKSYVDVYTYEDKDDQPVFEKIQTVSTLEESYNGISAAYAIQLTADGRYLICSNAGDESVAVFSRDEKTGLLTQLFVLPVSGYFPKDITTSDDNKYLISINNESNTITFFTLDMEKKTMIMNGPEMKYEAGNCLILYRLDET